MTKGAESLARVFDKPLQRAIAAKLSISEGHLSLLIAGKRIPSIRIATRIERELGISVQSWSEETTPLVPVKCAGRRCAAMVSHAGAYCANCQAAAEKSA